MFTATIIQHLSANWPGLAVLLVVIVLSKILLAARSRVLLDELRVLSALRGLDTGIYQHFQNLDLPDPSGSGSIRIEHVVVSSFGIFVIGTNNRSGRISGTELDPEWLQRDGFRRKRFENPLLGSRLRVDALMALLNLPDPPFRPVVAFAQDCVFRNPHPAIVPCDSLIAWIRRHRVTLLDPSMVRRAVSRLEAHQEALNRKSEALPQVHALHVRQAV